MRTLLLFSLTVLLSQIGFGQDTTSWRMVSVTDNGDFYFFASDSTELTTVGNAGGSGHAVFINPDDRMLYAVIDLVGGDRILYQANPFTGNLTLFHDFSEGHIHTADIANGVVYAMSGNGGATPGEIFELDLSSMTESQLIVSSIGGNGTPRALEFNPTDSSIYVYEGYADQVAIIDLSTTTESVVATTGMVSSETHGAFYSVDSDNFLITSYFSESYVTDNTYLNGTLFDAPVEAHMDISDLLLINSDDTTGYCPGDSTMLALLYDGINSVLWYKDGVSTGMTSDTIYTSTTGTYRALVEIGTGGTHYIWSEPILVEAYTSPNVSISQATNDTLICPGDTIFLQGANGGSLQWYLDGAAISGANSNTYGATAVGSYNQMKTNMSGCSDTAAMAYVIYVDPNCPGSVEDINAPDVNVFPNPVQDVMYLEASDAITSVEILDLEGRVVSHVAGSLGTNYSLSTSGLANGIYQVRIMVDDQMILRKIVK